MNARYILLISVVRQRVENGEELNAVLDSYPKLTCKQREEVTQTLKG